MTADLDLNAIRADLEYASAGIDGADMPYHPHALHAMRAAEKLLAEVDRLTAENAELRRTLRSLRETRQKDIEDTP